MNVCHKCPHDREIARLREICTRCKGASDNFGGNVHFEAAGDPSRIMRHACADYLSAVPRSLIDGRTPADPPITSADLPPGIDIYLLRIVREFVALPKIAVEVAHGLANGHTFEELGKRRGVSKMAVSNIYKRALRKCPWLFALKPNRGDHGFLSDFEKRLLKAWCAGVPLTAQAQADGAQARTPSHRCEDRPGEVNAAATATPGNVKGA